MLDEVLKDGRVQLVIDRLALSFGDDEPTGPEHREMPRDGRPARMELVGDFAGRPWARAEEIENLPPRFVGQRTVERVGKPPPFFHN